MLKIFYGALGALCLTVTAFAGTDELSQDDFIPIRGSLQLPFSRLSHGTTLYGTRDYEGEDRFFGARKAAIVNSAIDEMVAWGAETTVGSAFGDAQMHVLEIGPGRGKSTARILDHIITNVRAGGTGPQIQLHSWDEWRASEPPASVVGQTFVPKGREGKQSNNTDSDSATKRQVYNDIHHYLSNVLIESHLAGHDMAEFAATLRVVYALYGMGVSEEDSADRFLTGTLEFSEPFVRAYANTIPQLVAGSVDTTQFSYLPNLNGGARYGLIYIDTDSLSDESIPDEFQGILQGAWNSLSDRGILVIDDCSWSPDGGTTYPIRDQLSAFLYNNWDTMFPSRAGDGPTSLTDFHEREEHVHIIELDAETGLVFQGTRGNGMNYTTAKDNLAPLIEAYEVWGIERGRWITIIRRDHNSADILP